MTLKNIFLKVKKSINILYSDYIIYPSLYNNFIL